MAIVFSLLGWVLIFVAGFIAIGDPMPGPGYEAAQETKRYATIAAMSLSLLCSGLGLVRGVRRFQEQKVVSVIAITLSVLWGLLLIASFVFRNP